MIPMCMCVCVCLVHNLLGRLVTLNFLSGMNVSDLI